LRWRENAWGIANGVLGFGKLPALRWRENAWGNANRILFKEGRKNIRNNFVTRPFMAGSKFFE
jgi:hypothetical protein